MTNIHTAAFAPGSRSAMLEALWQWDYGQILQFVGLDLPDAYEVHFSNCPNGESTTALGNVDGVPIPDMYFVSGQPIYAWVYLHTGANDGETVYTVTIPINRRARPTADPPSEREQDIFTAGVALLSAKIDDIDNVARYAAEAKEAAHEAELSNANPPPFILAMWHDWTYPGPDYSRGTSKTEGGVTSHRTSRFYTSLDGVNFVEFNKAIYPLMVDNSTSVPPREVGAPSIVWWNGYFMIVTSSAPSSETVDHAIGVSEDLIHWRWYDYTLGVRFENVTPKIYAPELCVLGDDLYVVQGIAISNDTTPDFTGTAVTDSRTYAARVSAFTEADGFTFDTAFQMDFYSDTTPNIDTTVVYDARQHKYFALVKNEYLRVVQSFSSTDLQTWTMLNDHLAWRFTEGSTACFYGGVWHVYVDSSVKNRGAEKWIYHLTTHDFATFTAQEPLSADCDYTIQHGSVFAITDRDAINICKSVPDFAIGGCGIEKRDTLYFYTSDIKVDTSSGNTRTMNYMAVTPGTLYGINLNNRDGVIQYLDNAANVDFARILLGPNVTSGSLTIVNSGAGSTYTQINETAAIDKATRELMLYRSPQDSLLHIMAGISVSGVPSGGTTGQMLVKASGSDFATEWADQPTVPVTDVQVNGVSIVSDGVANLVDTVVSGEITAGENVTIVSQALRRKGSVVQLQARITASSELTDPLTAADTLFTVPTGFRPAESTTVLGWRTGDYTTLPVGIGTNGKCKLFGSASLAPGVSAIINTTYIIS